MNSDDKKNKYLRTDDDMMRRILLHRCGVRERDEYAADELECGCDEYIPYDEEFGEDEGIGEPDYFSTCEYTMISDDDDTVNCQGS